MAKRITGAHNQSRVTLAAGVTAQVGDLIGYSAGWVLADADARIPARYIACTAGVASDIRVAESGILYDDASTAPYTAGDLQYLSATAGAHTATIPAVSTTLTILQPIGHALTTRRMSFDLARRTALRLRASAAVDPASGGTDTVQNLAVTVTGVLATDYARLASAPTVVQGVIYNGSVVCTADTVTVGIANASAGTVDGASTTVEFLVERD